jgi:hypothetical protein
LPIYQAGERANDILLVSKILLGYEEENNWSYLITTVHTAINPLVTLDQQ